MPESAAPSLAPFEYVVVRVVPRVERGECLNVGVILVCRPRRFLDARVELDRRRLAAFAPYVDDETVDLLARQLALIPRICAGDPTAGPIAAFGLGERWHWLAAPASTLLQPGSVHTGLCVDPSEELDFLFEEMVRVPGFEPA
ncbi:MAG: hypothetical protein QOJ59_3590 [Thermomicrobiales bacterium]|nr:hypothetical protein [Thermomicrobiales bacterium]